MRQFAAYEGTWHEKYQTWRWHQLMRALEMVGHPAPDVQHRALQDTEATRQIVQSMAAGVEPQARSDAVSAMAIPSEPEPRESSGEPIRPDVIHPGDRERFGEDPRGWETRSGQFPGGQFTVISTRTRGCSPGLLAAILIGGTLAIGVGCCLFFVLFARLL
jgi:hypothetical protein